MRSSHAQRWFREDGSGLARQFGRNAVTKDLQGWWHRGVGVSGVPKGLAGSPGGVRPCQGWRGGGQPRGGGVRPCQVAGGVGAGGRRLRGVSVILYRFFQQAVLLTSLMKTAGHAVASPCDYEQTQSSEPARGLQRVSWARACSEHVPRWSLENTVPQTTRYQQSHTVNGLSGNSVSTGNCQLRLLWPGLVFILVFTRKSECHRGRQSCPESSWR